MTMMRSGIGCHVKSGILGILKIVILAPIYGYRFGLSPLLGVNCRFSPSCSAYAIEAIQLHGPIKGVYLAAKRMSKCHPWGGSGVDPVPKQAKHEKEQ